MSNQFLFVVCIKFERTSVNFPSCLAQVVEPQRWHEHRGGGVPGSSPNKDKHYFVCQVHSLSKKKKKKKRTRVNCSSCLAQVVEPQC